MSRRVKLPALLALCALWIGSGCGETPNTDVPPSPGEVTVVKGPADNANNGALIPRSVIFDNPDKAGARISPDGKRLSYLAPVDGVLNVWVGPADDPSKAKPVTKDTKRGIRSYFWAYTGNHIIYRQDTGGDENWHVYSVNLDTNKTTDLTPMKGVAAKIEAVSHKFPGEIVLGVNEREKSLHDLFRVNVATGERKEIQRNPGFAGFQVDDDFRVRFASKYAPDGGVLYLKPDGKDGWEEFLKVPQADSLTTELLDFDKTGDVLYMLDSRGRDTSALKQLNLKTGKESTLAENDKADIQNALIHPTEKTVLAASYTYDRKKWKVLDKSVEEDFRRLRGVADGEMIITSETTDNKQWIVAYVMDNGPIRYYHYDRDTKKSRFLFTNRSKLDKLKLARMHPVVIKSRDGMNLVSYLTLPPGSDTDGDAVPEKPLPMVLLVHGGPWSRNEWGYNSQHQWLANRGYAVLSVNFRGSTGFGKKFLNAGNRQWAAKMHDDLIDAVNWAKKNKVADPEKIAIMGGSYGGYATLVGLTFTPDVFACGVDIVGPSNIITLLKTIPAYWKPMMQVFKDRVGDISTEEGRKFLRERSPLTHVERIKRPLLIGQGANDPRVKQSESDQIVKAMQEKNIPVVYVLYPDEGHGFARPPNRMSFYAVTEAFLAKNLGGRFQPIGDDFKGSSIKVPEGAKLVPGVAVKLDE